MTKLFNNLSEINMPNHSNILFSNSRIETHKIGLKRLYKSALYALGLSLMNLGQVQAGAMDDPLVTMFAFDQLEIRDAEQDNPLVLEAQFWAGYDLEKLWLKTEFESVDGNAEEAELQLLYSRAIAPFWDLQAGWRRDFKLDGGQIPKRDWVVIGIQGLSPYFFEVDAALFIGESGRTAFRFEAEYELMLTQQWVLSPEVEVNFYGQNDLESGNGAGLAEIEFGLRLRYEIKREFAPYIGINWSKKYGNSADYASLQGQYFSDSQIVIGVRMWF